MIEWQWVDKGYCHILKFKGIELQLAQRINDYYMAVLKVFPTSKQVASPIDITIWLDTKDLEEGKKQSIAYLRSYFEDILLSFDTIENIE